MPYIDKETRDVLDPLIVLVAAEIDRSVPPEKHKGALNYTITRLAVMLSFSEARHNYHRLSDMKAAMTDAADEWYRRVLGPYEDKACRRNGDVYENYTKTIGEMWFKDDECSDAPINEQGN